MPNPLAIRRAEAEAQLVRAEDLALGGPQVQAFPMAPDGTGCGAMIRARWQSSPLIIVPTTTSVAAVLGPVKARPGNDGACGQGRATADLDRPCARRPQHVWVGAKKR